MFAPQGFCHNGFRFIVIKEIDTAGNNIISNIETLCKLSLYIVDDLEQKPLLVNHSLVRSVFLLSEMHVSVIAGLLALGATQPKITTIPSMNRLDISWTLSASCDFDSGIGMLMCLTTLLEALLFERGLKKTWAQLNSARRSNGGT